MWKSEPFWTQGSILSMSVLEGTVMLNEKLEDSITSRPAAWSTALQERNRGQLRGGVNHWVYFSYRQRSYRLIFPIIIPVSVSPDSYEGQG